MRDIKVSVVTVCLNAVDVIEKTIQSVINQDYDNIEYIIIDGASTDGTLDIISNYRDRISYICTEKDYGIYDAMNKGIRFATGDLIGFINAGDYYENEAISAMAKAFGETKADILYGDATLVSGNDKQYRSHENVDFEKYFEGNQIIHQSIFVKTSICKMNKYDTRYRLLADYDFFLRQYISGARFQYVKKNISFYDTKGLSSTEEIQSAYECRAILLNALTSSKMNKQERIEEIENDFLFKMFVIHCKELRQYSFYINDYMNNITAGYDKVVVFGVGEIATQIIKKINMRFDYYIDNNSELQGQFIDGKVVLPPTSLLKNQDESKFVYIFSTRYERPMEAELKLLSEKAKVGYLSVYRLGVEAERNLYGIGTWKNIACESDALQDDKV